MTYAGRAALCSHGDTDTFDMQVAQKRVTESHSDATSGGVTLAEKLSMLAQLDTFPLGQFLLRNQGLNGNWTDYVIRRGPLETNLSDLEHFLIHEAPVVLATRERAGIFKQKLQELVREGVHMASLPCGMMDDLLSLNFDGVPNVTLTGIDLDQESLDRAAKHKEAVTGASDAVQVHFAQQDAWTMVQTETYDVIASNGLNIYVDDDKAQALYGQFLKALKPGGVLVTSFLTPPPLLDASSPWKMNQLDMGALAKQKALMQDVIAAQWTHFRTMETMLQHLGAAGFIDVEVTYDSNGMFPTIVAYKPDLKLTLDVEKQEK